MDLTLVPGDGADGAFETDSAPAGTALGLRMMLGVFDLRGVVAWSRPSTAELGVRFVDLSEEAGSRMEEVVLLLAAVVA